MSKIVKSILMSQAPERPNWFEGHNIPSAPVMPSRKIERYSDLNDVTILLNSWLGDPHWDLDNTYDTSDQYPKGVDVYTFEDELNKFAQTWEVYWKAHYEWKKTVEFKLDIQWRVYWTNLALEELNEQE